jgi:hypothetical protein
VILLAGPEMLSAAAAIPFLSRIGAAMQRSPNTLSSLSTAKPDRRIELSSRDSAQAEVMVFGVKAWKRSDLISRSHCSEG